VKECGEPAENTPGYHPYRIVSDRPIVNPGWNKDLPESIMTATGRGLRRAHQPVRLIVRPERRGYFVGQSLTRAIALANDSLETQKLNLKVTLAGKEWQLGIVELPVDRWGTFERQNLLLRPWSARATPFQVGEEAAEVFSLPSRLFVDNRAYAVARSEVTESGGTRLKLSFRKSNPRWEN
jgi:hypothetical protein